MNEEPTSENRFSERARPWARLGIMVGVGTLTVALINMVDDVVNRFSSDIHDNAECCESFRSYRDEDSDQRHFWVGVIEELRGEVAKIATSLSRLRTEIAVTRTKVESLERAGSIPDDSELKAALNEIREGLKKLEAEAKQ